MSNISVFSFENNNVRTLVDGSGIWFVAKDVAETLGFKNTNDAISRHCKGVVKRDLPSDSGIQSYSIIKESDVYRLIMRSKLPSAERFQDWVCEDVLPSIRNTGGYEIPKTYAGVLQLAASQALLLEQQQEQLTKQAPKVEFFDKVAERTHLLNATQVGQNVGGFSARALNKTLEALDVYNMAVKRGRTFKQWFINKGYGVLIQTEGGFPQAMFTVKGEQWIFGKLNATNAA